MIFCLLTCAFVFIHSPVVSTCFCSFFSRLYLFYSFLSVYHQFLFVSIRLPLVSTCLCLFHVLIIIVSCNIQGFSQVQHIKCSFPAFLVEFHDPEEVREIINNHIFFLIICFMDGTLYKKKKKENSSIIRSRIYVFYVVVHRSSKE